ncbi:metallophosphoesterase [Clavibacter sp. VKM Ac-2873]|uniref:metallophosphoesterase family protein n=1 Tax=Clavibacter sp. VKM Ac-2873 TaxID=2783813 RepID=UPI002107C2E8|nr:metallophosphoesterase family protein [Clavibacter sp. VKM Ac-2873]
MRRVLLIDIRPERWDEVLRDVAPAVRTVVSGHTHMPFVRLVDGRLVIDAGSVGLPCGRSGAHWAVLEAGAVTIGRTPIEADELIRETAASPVTPDFRAWLEEAVGRPASDRDAMAAFGPRDGR